MRSEMKYAVLQRGLDPDYCLRVVNPWYTDPVVGKS